MRVILYAVFVLSGAAGLIYESIWARYLGLFVGHSAHAQILVIGIFLGGMALGALLIGSRSTKLRDPLKWYAIVEVLIGAIGVAFHDVYGAVTGVAYSSIFPALGGSPGPRRCADCAAIHPPGHDLSAHGRGCVAALPASARPDALRVVLRQ
jgi:hypothetical protein